MKQIIAIALSFSLAGCVTWGQMREGLDNLVGKPLSYAVDRLGLPTSEANVAGMHLVKWQSLSANEYQCLITLQIDQNNIVVKRNAEGNLGGCERYINALKK